MGGKLDAMTGFVVASLALGLAAGALLTGTHLIRRARAAAPVDAGAAGGAALLIGALLMIHTVGWGLRYSFDWIMSYFTSGLFWQPVGLPAEQRLLLTATENEPVLIVVEGGYSVFVPPLGRISELPALIGLALVLAALVVIAVAALCGTRIRTISSRQRSARVVHDMVTSLGDLLPWILGLGIPLSVVLMMLSEQVESTQLRVRLLDLLAIGVAMAVAFLVCFRGVRSALGTMADVAGFWPVVWHPLAGISYRDDVVAGIGSMLDRDGSATVALVGHSQGSVLCAWLAYCRGPAARPVVHLVTCGSPLRSLCNVVSWSNFWRHTDPIATALPGLDPRCDVELADTADGPLHGHRDYWIEPRLTTHIAHQLRGPAPPQR